MKYSTSNIKDLHNKYAPSSEVYDIVFTHCQVVHDVAMQLIEGGKFKVDAELVSVGCLVHDIGVYNLMTPEGLVKPGISYILHGVEGEKILKKEEFPEKLWRFGAHHTGVGLSKQDITTQNLPLPVADYFAETDEELLVMYADKFHSKTIPPYFNSFEWYKQDIARFGADKVIKFEQMAEKFGVPDLRLLSQKYGHTIR